MPMGHYVLSDQIKGDDILQRTFTEMGDDYDKWKKALKHHTRLL